MATIAVAIVMVIGLIIGAHYLQNLAGSTTTSSASAQSNLKAVLQSAQQYAAAHHESFAGVAALSADLAATNLALTFPPVSMSATEISLDQPNAGVLVMTSLQSSPLVCVGVVQVLTTQPAPAFVAYPATSQPGVYYFEAPTLASSCDARAVTPPAGGSFLSRAGFPGAPLP